MELITYRSIMDGLDLYPADKALECYVFGLVSEAGEVAGKMKKLARGDDVKKEAIIQELGDVLWYLDRLAKYFNYEIPDLASVNHDKLIKRQKEGTLRGDGDSR